MTDCMARRYGAIRHDVRVSKGADYRQFHWNLYMGWPGYLIIVLQKWTTSLQRIARIYTMLRCEDPYFPTSDMKSMLQVLLQHLMLGISFSQVHRTIYTHHPLLLAPSLLKLSS
jgi:hypothetical protein